MPTDVHDDTPPNGILKAPTGIAGLDEVTVGGLPRARTTLLCGGPGCGKTLMAMQFLVRGALDDGEPGVFVAFEESAHELTQNVHSLGWDLGDLVSRGLLAIDHVRIAEFDLCETGEWDLDGLLIRLGLAIESVGAKRVVLDTIEALFGALRNEALLRSELRRVFRWLNDRGVTAVVTGERGDGTLTRHGLEEYVSDCVIVLDHRVRDQISTRRLRVVKYRGSHHGPDEYPFLIDRTGFSVFPLSGMSLDHAASTELVSTGLAELDTMFSAGGLYRGSSILISGTPGSGKTTLAARFLEAGCERGERGVLFAFEESPAQVVRNMRSVGIDLQRHIDSGLLRFDAARPASYGLETHLARIGQVVAAFEPLNVVIDPLSSLDGEEYQLKSVLSRLIDEFKRREVTALMTTLIRGGFEEQAGLGISSVIDTWIDVSNLELDGERNRGINVLKARGMGHSSQVREFVLTSQGVEIRDVYTGDHGVLMGSARRSQEARDRAEFTLQAVAIEAQRRRLEQRRAALEAQIAALRAQLEAETLDLATEIEAGEQRERQGDTDRIELAASRRVTSPTAGNGHREARS